MAIDPQRPQITDTELDGWSREYTYDVNGNVETITVHAKTGTGIPVDYVKTFTWVETPAASGIYAVESISEWVEV